MDRGSGCSICRGLGFGRPKYAPKPFFGEIFEVAAAQCRLGFRPAIQLISEIDGGSHRDSYTRLWLYDKRLTAPENHPVMQRG
jgi:hypothetical protein